MKVPLFVFWCEDAALASASGSSVDARAPERLTCSISRLAIFMSLVTKFSIRLMKVYDAITICGDDWEWIKTCNAYAVFYVNDNRLSTHLTSLATGVLGDVVSKPDRFRGIGPWINMDKQ